MAGYIVKFHVEKDGLEWLQCSEVFEWRSVAIVHDSYESARLADDGYAVLKTEIVEVEVSDAFKVDTASTDRILEAMDRAEAM